MFHPLRVASIIEETPDAKSIVFEVPAVIAPTFVYKSGQFLTLRLDVAGKPVERCYSLSSAPEVEKIHKVTIKRVAGGAVSPLIHGRVKVGDRVDVKGPEGRFVLDKAEGRSCSSREAAGSRRSSPSSRRPSPRPRGGYACSTPTGPAARSSSTTSSNGSRARTRGGSRWPIASTTSTAPSTRRP